MLTTEYPRYNLINNLQLYMVFVFLCVYARALTSFIKDAR
jgi:hypothetical protein